VSHPLRKVPNTKTRRCADPQQKPQLWLAHVLAGTRQIDTRGQPIPEMKQMAGLAGTAAAEPL